MVSREPTLLLVGGTGRSGTTITRQVLSKHPSVSSFPNEVRLLADPDGVAALARVALNHPTPHELDVSVRRFLVLLSDISRPHQLIARARTAGSGENTTRATQSRRPTGRRIGRSIGRRVVGSRAMPRYPFTDLTQSAPRFRELADRMSGAMMATSWRGRWVGMGRHDPSRMFLPTPEFVIESLRHLVSDLMTDAAAAGRSSTYVTDDTPTVLRAAGELAHLLPGRVRAIELVRDPRDVVVSLRGSRWAPDSMAGCVEFYKVARASAAAGLSQLRANDVYTLRLEMLVESPATSLQQLADWLSIDVAGFPVEPALALRKGSTARWRTELDATGAAQLEDLLRDELLSLGYPLGG